MERSSNHTNRTRHLVGGFFRTSSLDVIRLKCWANNCSVKKFFQKVLTNIILYVRINHQIKEHQKKGKVIKMVKYFVLDTDYNEIVKGKLMTEEEYNKLVEEYSEYVVTYEDEEGETMDYVRCETLQEALGSIKDDIENNLEVGEKLHYSVEKTTPNEFIAFCVFEDSTIHELD